MNVAQLLKEPVGSTRIADVHLDRLALDESTIAFDVSAKVRLTRVIEGILADGQMSGKVELECVRCLELYTQEFAGEFEADFRPSVDVRTGDPLQVPEFEDIFVIDNNHELDLDELLRQISIISLPMQALCREDCPGIEQVEDEDEEAGDERLAVLRDLLEAES
ncbi:MAG: DUF177 domain-containing protein [Nitrolancea sp.]